MEGQCLLIPFTIIYYIYHIMYNILYHCYNAMNTSKVAPIAITVQGVTIDCIITRLHTQSCLMTVPDLRITSHHKVLGTNRVDLRTWIIHELV